MDKVFKDLIETTMDIYVDDMVVKSSNVEDHSADLDKVFEYIRAHDMRLNLEKCFTDVLY